MRTRELLGKLHAKISLTSSSKDKKEIIDLCARIEQAELNLRRHRLTGEALISGSHGRIGARCGRKQRSAQEARLAALLREVGEGDAKKVNALPVSPGKPESTEGAS